MKRALAATGATVAGVVWLLTYKVTPPHLGPVAAAESPSSTRDATPTPAAAPSPSPSPQAAVAGTFTGTDVPNRFGDVQVRVIITGGRISDVQALHLPFDRAESAYISQVAGPMLRTEALQAQSANIDIISGATYTSDSYAQSLETALRLAHRG